MRLVLIALLLLPSVALADPVIVPIILATGASYTAVVVTMLQIGFMVGSAIYGNAQKRKAERKAREQHNASLQDRMATRIATEAPYVYVYGRARVGSSIVAVFTSGDKDQYQHLVCVHAAHECDAIEEIWVANKPLGALDSNGFAVNSKFVSSETKSGSSRFTGSIVLPPNTIASSVGVTYKPRGDDREKIPFSYNPSTRVVTCDRANADVSYQYTVYSYHVRVQKHLGTPTDPADAYLRSVTSKWTANHVLRGFCYTVIRLDLNQPEFQGGIPEISVRLKGKKLFDPRTGLTEWSQNNALAIRDYLTGPVCNIDPADLPEDDFITAANVCDEAQSFGPRYTFNGAVFADEDKKQALERMAQSMAGGIDGTTWSIWAGKYTAPVMALDANQGGDCIGSLAINPGTSDADLYNTVHGQYISAENKYVATDFKPYVQSVYMEADGRELVTNIDFPYTDNVRRVHNLCRIFTEDQRQAYTVKGQFSLKAWSLKVGQRVTLSSTLFGWNNKVFRVTDKSYSPTSAIELTLKEDAASIWDFADAVLPDETPNSDLPNPFDIAAPGSVTCVSGDDQLLRMQDGTIVSRILVAWPASSSGGVFNTGTVEIQAQQVGSDVWQKIEARGDETQGYVTDVEDGDFYTVRVRFVDPYLNVKSDWTYADLHQVIGKSAPPPNIADLSISGAMLDWSPVDALDLRGYVFRFHYGSNLDWGTAAPLHQGVITEFPFDLVTRPSGVVTIMGKAVDTSGNESKQAAVIVTNLGDAPIANIVETVDFQAGGFPGAIEGGTIVGGELIADETDSFYGSDNQSFYGPDNEPFYPPSTYAQLVYTTEDVSVAGVLAGSIMTLEIDSEGIDLIVEYRLAGPGPIYGAGSDSFYGEDDESFYVTPGAWQAWPGQIVAANDVFKFRVTLGAGEKRSKIKSMALVIDAPDIVEYIEDVEISEFGTVIPYTKNFRVIKTVTATLQANTSSAVTVEADKSVNLAPALFAYNAAHVPVSGATSDVIIKGY